MNLNGKQWLAIVIVVVGVLSVSSTQLTAMFGAETAKIIVNSALMINTMFGGILAVVTGQSSLIRDVMAMPGVQKIEVNSQANKTLAQIAVDPKADKIAPLQESIDAVTQTAKGT